MLEAQCITAMLSSQDAAFYAEHGWIVPPVTLDPILLDEALAGLEQHWTGYRDYRLPDAGKYFVDWMPGDEEGTRNNEYISLQNHRVRRLALSPVIGAAAASLTRSTPIRLFDDQMIVKLGGQSGQVVGWHIDKDYWRTCTSREMLTAWIPLHDCPEEFGPLVVLDGSHKWSDKLDHSDLSFHLRDMESLANKVRQLGYEFRPVAMSLRRGQFSLHHCRAIHGSYPNRTKSPRTALAVHLQDGGNSYCAAFHPDGRPVQLFNDRICRKTPAGLPDYTDDFVFPALWAGSLPELSAGAAS